MSNVPWNAKVSARCSFWEPKTCWGKCKVIHSGSFFSHSLKYWSHYLVNPIIVTSEVGLKLYKNDLELKICMYYRVCTYVIRFLYGKPFHFLTMIWKGFSQSFTYEFSRFFVRSRTLTQLLSRIVFRLVGEAKDFSAQKTGEKWPFWKRTRVGPPPTPTQVLNCNQTAFSSPFGGGAKRDLISS